MKARKIHNPYLIYTVLFPLAAAMVFSFFLYSGKSMMWKRDGVYQHYNAFLYLGSWMRTILQTLITEHRFIIPMFEWGLGYGSDVITTLSYYTFGDPFALISVITPTKYGEIGFVFSFLHGRPGFYRICQTYEMRGLEHRLRGVDVCFLQLLAHNGGTPPIFHSAYGLSSADIDRL